MTVLYNFFISAYILGIRVASLWNKKAKEWLTGRENVFDELAKKIGNNLNIIWVHCSSAGEFEQA
ncbi:MAG TPA: 3-deoxy-D-manno-octulosonic acid transferase, partial [Flavisolibacter sp.]|nr:3-deoxy-D-manno-octulosonic acid transferase [Flavisolibacter sp.]